MRTSKSKAVGSSHKYIRGVSRRDVSSLGSQKNAFNSIQFKSPQGLFSKKYTHHCGCNVNMELRAMRNVYFHLTERHESKTLTLLSYPFPSGPLTGILNFLLQFYLRNNGDSGEEPTTEAYKSN